MGNPEHYQATHLLFAQTKATTTSLKKELGYAENHYPACIAALKTAKATLVEAEALLDQVTPPTTSARRNPNMRSE